MAAFAVSETTVEGYPAIRLARADGTLAAAFCPSLGMVGCSLEHDGAELLGLRGGLHRYEAQGSTLGIPLLHPWANRLSGFAYSVAGREVKLDRDSPLLHLDPDGLPIHGLLAASPYWTPERPTADDSGARLSATLDFGAHPELLEGFPFPHELRIEVALGSDSLTLRTQLTATGDVLVPVSFGYHPYLRLPGVARGDWYVELPVSRRLVLDERMIPTGESQPVDIAPGPLGERAFDDAFCDLPANPRFVLAGGGRRVELEFEMGYPYAQVYAPGEQEVICFEPMTAPTNALVSAGAELKLVKPGESYGAGFRIRVRRA